MASSNSETREYSCSSTGPRNNGLVDECNWSGLLGARIDGGFEPTYHCPICAAPLKRAKQGPSVSEVLREGQRRVDASTHKNDKL